MKNLILFFLIILLLGCTNIELKNIDKKPLNIEKIKLEMDVEPYFIRQNIIKKENTLSTFVEEDYLIVRRDTPYKSYYDRVVHHKKKTPFHYLVFRFGSGLIYDVNGNLSIDLVEMFNIEREFKIIKKEKSILNTVEKYKRRKNIYKRTYRKKFDETEKIKFIDDGLLIYSDFYNTKMKINKENNKISYFSNESTINKGSIEIVKKDDNYYKLNGFYKDFFIKKEFNSVDINNILRIKAFDNKTLKIMYKKNYESREIVFSKIENGFIVKYDKDEIVGIKNGNKIYIFINNKINNIYIIK